MLQKSAFKYLDFLAKCIMLYFPLSREKVIVEPGTAISVSVRFGRLFASIRHRMIFFAGNELKHVARPVESDLHIST